MIFITQRSLIFNKFIYALNRKCSTKNASVEIIRIFFSCNFSAELNKNTNIYNNCLRILRTYFVSTCAFVHLIFMKDIALWITFSRDLTALNCNIIILHIRRSWLFSYFQFRNAYAMPQG